MTTDSTVLPEHAIWQQFLNEKQPAHFYHANGFPLNVYTPFLSELKQHFSLSALQIRPTWEANEDLPKSRDWDLYANDLIAFIEQHCSTPIIGIGHSLGGASTVIAATKRPELFQSIVLVEPAMVSRPLSLFMHVVPKALLNLTQPAKGTLRKRDSWSSREAFIDEYKHHPIYKNFNEQALDSLAQHAVKKNSKEEYQLVYPKNWEAHIYTKPPCLMNKLQNLKVPCVAIRGKPSFFFPDKLWNKWQKTCPNTIFLEDFNAGHLIPLEEPIQCCELILKGLRELSKQ